MAAIAQEEACKYSMTPGKQIQIEGITALVYGISAEDRGGIVTTIEDISSDPVLVKKMAELFTLCELRPERLAEAVMSLLP